MKIGVVINHLENSDTGKTPNYPEIRQMAQAADAGNLDSIWLFDHLLFRFTEESTLGIWECWTLLSALAEATNNVELGTLVLCNPFRNPALLAKMAHTLDEVSNGRVILGLGAGWHQPEFDAFGYPFDYRVSRFNEAVQIMNPLLKGETVDFEGKYYQAKDCVITPPSPRKEGVPLLVGAFSPRMLRLTAQYADKWNTAWLTDPAQLAERLQKIHNACTEVGRDPATLEVTVAIETVFPHLDAGTPMVDGAHSGSAEEIAQVFQGYADVGVSHLIVMPNPATETAVQCVAEAARLFKN